MHRDLSRQAFRLPPFAFFFVVPFSTRRIFFGGKAVLVPGCWVEISDLQNHKIAHRSGLEFMKSALLRFSDTAFQRRIPLFFVTAFFFVFRCDCIPCVVSRPPRGKYKST